MSESCRSFLGCYQQGDGYEEIKEERMNNYGKEKFNTFKNNLKLYLGAYFDFNVIMMLAENTASTEGCDIEWYSKTEIDMIVLWISENFEKIGESFLDNVNHFLMSQATSQVKKYNYPIPIIDHNSCNQRAEHFSTFADDNQNKPVSQCKGPSQEPDIEMVGSGFNTNAFTFSRSNEAVDTTNWYENEQFLNEEEEVAEEDF